MPSLLASVRCLLLPALAGCLGEIDAARTPDPPPSAPIASPFTVDHTLAPALPAPTTVNGISTQAQPTFADVKAGGGRAVPLSGGTLLVLRGGKTALAADPDRDRLFLVDLDLGKVLADIPLLDGDQPGRAVEDGAGRLHVVLRGGGAIATLAPGSFALERRALCSAPRGIAAHGERLYVACAGGELLALPAAGGEALWTRKLEPDLRDVVVGKEGELLVTTFRSARVFSVSPDGVVKEPRSLPLSLNLTRRGTAAGGEGPAATRYRPAVAWRTVPAPGGGAFMLHQRAFTGEVAATVRGPSTAGGYTGGNNCGGGIVQTVVSAIGPDGNGKPAPELGGILLGIDLALSPDGKTLAMVSAADEHVRGLGSVVVVGSVNEAIAPNDEGCVVAAHAAFSGPSAEPTREGFWQPLDGAPFRGNRLLGQAVAVAFDGAGDVVVQMREPAEVRVPARRVRIALATTSHGDVGHAIFHANTGAGIACASCHPEGGDDGHTWRFVDLGPRRTQSLRGGLSDTLPLHWDGDMRDVGQIAREVFTGRMSGPTLGSGETEALVKWLDQLPLPPASSPVDADAVARGQALFQDRAVGCATCHVGPRLTNNQTVDVGTGRPLQVPSLRGLSARAPYMHTGCAPTLAARFSASCGGGDRHGTTTHLSQQQAADLTSYLESL